MQSRDVTCGVKFLLCCVLLADGAVDCCCLFNALLCPKAIVWDREGTIASNGGTHSVFAGLDFNALPECTDKLVPGGQFSSIGPLGARVMKLDSVVRSAGPNL